MIVIVNSFSPMITNILSGIIWNYFPFEFIIYCIIFCRVLTQMTVCLLAYGLSNIIFYQKEKEKHYKMKNKYNPKVKIFLI